MVLLLFAIRESQYFPFNFEC